MISESWGGNLEGLWFKVYGLETHKLGAHIVPLMERKEVGYAA